MKEVSAGAIIFKREKEIKYLLLFRKKDEHFSALWSFPRGKIEENETDIDAAKREIEEETGLDDIKFLENFKEKINWFYKKDAQVIYKESTFFLAEYKSGDVKISEEHNDFKWCNYKEAMELLKFKNIKEVLEKADKFLKHSLMNWV